MAVGRQQWTRSLSVPAGQRLVLQHLVPTTRPWPSNQPSRVSVSVADPKWLSVLPSSAHFEWPTRNGLASDPVQRPWRVCELDYGAPLRSCDTIRDKSDFQPTHSGTAHAGMTAHLQYVSSHNQSHDSQIWHCLLCMLLVCAVLSGRRQRDAGISYLQSAGRTTANSAV